MDNIKEYCLRKKSEIKLQETLTCSAVSPQLSERFVTRWLSVPQGVRGNGHYALGALLGGEARGVLQGLVRQRGQMEARLVRVAEPGAAGHCQHLAVRRDGDAA